MKLNNSSLKLLPDGVIYMLDRNDIFYNLDFWTVWKGKISRWKINMILSLKGSSGKTVEPMTSVCFAKNLSKRINKELTTFSLAWKISTPLQGVFVILIPTLRKEQKEVTFFDWKRVLLVVTLQTLVFSTLPGTIYHSCS